MLRLLPPVCRDCGKSGEKILLSPYLGFLLCGPCVRLRERAMREGVLAPGRRKPGSKKPEKPPADGSKVKPGSRRKRNKP